MAKNTDTACVLFLIFKTDSKAQTQNLQYKSIETPPPFSLKIDVDYK